MSRFAKRGRPRKDRRLHRLVAAAVDYRGINDDQLTFLFRNVDRDVLIQTFQFLVGRGHGIAAKAVVTEEHDIIRRNGKGYWRYAVEIREPNFSFASLEDMQLLISARISKAQPASVRWFNIQQFLNI